MNSLLHSLNVLASQGPTVSSTDFCFAEPMWLWGLCVLPLLLLLRRRRGSAAAIQHPGIRFLADKLPAPTALAGAFGPLTLTLTAACILFDSGYNNCIQKTRKNVVHLAIFIKATIIRGRIF